jgi:hypothetical protein
MCDVILALQPWRTSFAPADTTRVSLQNTGVSIAATRTRASSINLCHGRQSEAFLPNHLASDANL